MKNMNMIDKRTKIVVELFMKTYKYCMDSEYLDVLDDYLVKGMSFLEIAEKRGVGEQRVKNIYNETIKRISGRLDRFELAEKHTEEYYKSEERLNALNDKIEIAKRLLEKNKFQKDWMEKLYETKIENCGFSNTTAKLLKGNGVKNVLHLLQQKPSELMKFRRFGHVALEEVERFIEREDLKKYMAEL